ncbi:hypothetical protein [Mariniflexile sp.]|uniref:hypothetical protein n=1 Tax=Mariniflexile sp. TaxID=1979402 RepID=UPI004048DAC3
MDKEILLKDKKPEYQVDEIVAVLYYKANNKTIYAYSLQKQTLLLRFVRLGVINNIIALNLF